MPEATRSEATPGPHQGGLAARASRARGPSRPLAALLWQRFFSHRLAVASLGVLVALTLASLAAPLIAAA